MKFYKTASLAIAFAFSSPPAWAIVSNYTPGATTLKANQDGFDFEINNEVSSPGDSIKLYYSPSKINGIINCLTPTLGRSIGYFASSVTGGSDFTSPTTGKAVTMGEMDVYATQFCDPAAWAHFNVSTVRDGTAKYKVFGTLKSYIVEVTFGPSPSDPTKTVVLRLRTNSD